jgi:NAD(P)-dependent dehydrogenase (short-subunit alcohol dehydrogenase family)
MTSEPEHPVALVTGGSRGIGRAIVEALAGEGYRVFFASRTGEYSAGGPPAALAPRIRGIAADVSRPEQVALLVEQVMGTTGRIDVLVNNAGIGRFAPVDELTYEQWREVLETNLTGAYLCLREVAPIMKQQGSGFVVNIASLAGRHGMAGGAAYNASKFGMVGLSEAAMLDLRPHGVRVTVVLPGSVDTEFHTRADRQWMIQPEDVAQVVLSLLRVPHRTLPSLVEMRPTQPPAR